ncbi:MAG: hypothetical protein WAX69_13145 [Victivallales bacterium]
MQAIEFEADVKNSSIKIPGRFGMLESKHLRLVALFDSDTQVSVSKKKASFIDNLLLNPLKVKNFKPMKREEVYER